MRRRDFREKKQPLVMIIPMIDIMLFLLIFFMLSTIYMVQTNNFNVDLPKTEETIQQEMQQSIVSITVTGNGEIFYEDNKILLKNLSQIVNYELTKNAETIFIIYGDKNVRYEKIANVLDIMKKAGANRVSIATELKK